jgi:hypothetical protein
MFRGLHKGQCGSSLINAKAVARRFIFIHRRLRCGTESAVRTPMQADKIRPPQPVQIAMNAAPDRAVTLTGDGANQSK